jgi:hypothetical protein
MSSFRGTEKGSPRKARKTRKEEGRGGKRRDEEGRGGTRREEEGRGGKRRDEEGLRGSREEGVGVDGLEGYTCEEELFLEAFDEVRIAAEVGA